MSEDTLVARGKALIRAFLHSHFFHYAVIGTLGLLVDIAALRIALEVFGLGFYVGRVFSFGCAVTFTYLCNRNFTFRDVPHKPLLRQWVAYATAQLGGLTANYATYAALITWWPLTKDYPEIAVACGAIAGLGFNYTAASRIVFRPAKG